MEPPSALLIRKRREVSITGLTGHVKMLTEISRIQFRSSFRTGVAVCCLSQAVSEKLNVSHACTHKIYWHTSFVCPKALNYSEAFFYPIFTLRSSELRTQSFVQDLKEPAASIFRPENGGSRLLRNVGNHQLHCAQKTAIRPED
jgi:hypothetical protein